MNHNLRILTLEPYLGDSHKIFLDGLSRFSRHEWQIVTLPPRHWKWRMRSAPLAMIQPAVEALNQHRPEPSNSVDVLFCSDMLDLPTWLGLALGDSRLRIRLLSGDRLPLIVTYFHENQWTYPISPDARTDHHFGYTNLLTALASDACWFNSSFHKESFLEASRQFIRRMPDTVAEHDFESLGARSRVMPPGFPERAGVADREHRSDRPLRLGWTSRWEYDKRPDQLAELLDRLAERSINFELILLGQRARTQTATQSNGALNQIRQNHASRILHDGYAQSAKDYSNWLSQMDVIVSTAEHEFFGIGICESVWCGAVPVVPDRLSYVELLPSEFRYKDLDEAATQIEQLVDEPTRQTKNSLAKAAIKHLRQREIVRKIDDELERMNAQQPTA